MTTRRSMYFLWQFQYRILQRLALAEELQEIVKTYTISKDIKERKIAFLVNAFLMARFNEIAPLPKKESRAVPQAIVEEKEIVDLVDGRISKVKQSPEVFRERTTFPKEYRRDYGFPTNSELVYVELSKDDIDKDIFDKDFYPRLDRRRFKSHDADGISTYTSKISEVSREELAKESPKDFQKSKGGIVSRKPAKPKYKKGQYLIGLGREKEKKLADFLHAERLDLQKDFHGKAMKIQPREEISLILPEESEKEKVDDFLNRIRTGNGRSKEKVRPYRELGYHTLILRKK